MLNIIGDSHVNTFSGYEYTRIWEIDPELSIKNIRSFSKPILEALSSYPYEVWAFQVGERDIRNHFLPDSISKNITIEQAIEETYQSYIQFIIKLCAVYDISVMTTPPQGILSSSGSEIMCPREIRHVNSIKFNTLLSTGATRTLYKCLDLWKMGAHPNDMITTEYFQEDGLHIKPALAETALRHALKTWKNPQVSRK